MTGSVMVSETERVRRRYDAQAARYDSIIRVSEKLFFGGGREWLCGQAAGDVLEIGIGTGRNLPYYPAGVRLTGVDISPGMLEFARRRAAALGTPVDLRVGDAQMLEFDDASFDTVVCALSMCGIPDVEAAVAEAGRVLRPGGRLLLLEHVGSNIVPVWLIQAALEPLWRLAGEHLLRRPLKAVRAQGLEIQLLQRSRWGVVERIAARKPSSTGSDPAVSQSERSAAVTRAR